MGEQLRRITINGSQIIDKHTHYEYQTYAGQISAVVEIMGADVNKFYKKYGRKMFESKFEVDVEFMENGRKIRESQNQFRGLQALVGRIISLDNILFVEEEKKGL